MNNRKRAVKTGSTRRTSAALMGATLTLSLVACASPGTQEGGPSDGAAGDATELSFVGYGGDIQAAMDKAWLDPYQADNAHVKIVTGGPPETAKLKAMVQSGQTTWDVVYVGTISYDPADFLEPLDCAVIDCDGIDDSIPFNGYSMPVNGNQYMLAYRTDAFGGDVPQDWRDYFNFEKFPGKRALVNSITAGIFEQLLLGDGVSPDELYPLDIERAMRKLNEVKDNIVWWTTSGECLQLLLTGEVNMANCSAALYPAALEEEGAAFDVQWNQAIAYWPQLAVPKDSPNKDEAMKLIAYMTNAENGAAISEFLPYAAANTTAAENLSPKFAGWYTTDHADEVISLGQDGWYQKNGPEAAELLAKFLSGDHE